MQDKYAAVMKPLGLERGVRGSQAEYQRVKTWYGKVELLDEAVHDEALDRLRKTSELEPTFWMPHLFASNAYIEKGMYTEAIAEARLTRKLAPLQTTSVAYESYALAKSGRLTEARAGLDELLKLSTERFVPPVHIAIIYNGLGEHDEALALLERGFEQRDTRMTFLKIDPKMSNLRSEPRFIDLMKRMKFQ